MTLFHNEKQIKNGFDTGRQLYEPLWKTKHQDQGEDERPLKLIQRWTSSEMLLIYLNDTIYGLSTIWFSSFSTQTLAFCSAQRNHGGSLIESVSGLYDAISAGVSRGSLIEECKWCQGIKHANEKECVWISGRKKLPGK